MRTEGAPSVTTLDERAKRSGPSFFSIRRDDAGGLPVVVLEGEVDLVTAPQLAAAMGSFSPGDAVVVDVCELEFMDSTGARELLRAAARLGDGLRVACRREGPVRRLFEIVALEELLDVHPSRAEALRAASAGSGAHAPGAGS
jgi:anti-sigma B factor antagonist